MVPLKEPYRFLKGTRKRSLKKVGSFGSRDDLEASREKKPLCWQCGLVVE